MSIRILLTGGTFDKEYDERTGTLFFKDTHLRDMLKLGRCRLEVEFRTLMMIDSLDMDDEDREVILSQCRKCDLDRIVITHGTDTMAETAQALLGLGDKTIVLTGALTPARFKSSDAMFNVGMAVAAAQLAPPGVYIAMSGQVFEAGHVRKNRQENRFEST